MLEDAVVADHHWNNRHLASDTGQRLEGVQQPADGHVRVDRTGELAGPESRGVLEDGDELVVGDQLLQESAVDVAALVALA